jgi:hypothetical protein
LYPQPYGNRSWKLLDAMRAGGIFFLLSGWIIVLAAVALLGTAAAGGVFVAAGLALELAGMALVLRSHMARRAHRR